MDASSHTAFMLSETNATLAREHPASIFGDLGSQASGVLTSGPSLLSMNGEGDRVDPGSSHEPAVTLKVAA
jgi:hypothetical protein